MKTKWKRAFLWSSLGSVAVGISVALVRKSRRPPQRPAADFRQIPPGGGASILTEPFGDKTLHGVAQDRYVLRPTAFKVWSVLDLQPDSSANSGGEPIYHVTHWRTGGTHNAEAAHERVLERFYATLRCVEAGESRPQKNRIAAAATLELPRCYVGGTSNGIESGEIHTSAAPILDFKLDPPAVDRREIS